MDTVTAVNLVTLAHPPFNFLFAISIFRGVGSIATEGHTQGRKFYRPGKASESYIFFTNIVQLVGSGCTTTSKRAININVKKYHHYEQCTLLVLLHCCTSTDLLLLLFAFRPLVLFYFIVWALMKIHTRLVVSKNGRLHAFGRLIRVFSTKK